MSRAVVFTTPGLIDIRAFTTFGVNAKPNTANPIGYFGTGLKYAVAVLVRLGCQPRVMIGRDVYTFYVKETKFRDKDIRLIRMKRQKWSLLRATHHDLPFTTELGKNWKVWQAFRELESNTRDENGATCLEDDGATVEPQPDVTKIIVANEEFVQAYFDRDTVFLPGALTKREATDRVQIFERPSKAIYYRGLRVADLEKPTLHTYNFLSPVDLTEDRTIKYQFSVRAELARHVVTSHDPKFIEQVLVCDDDKWEHGLEFDYQSEVPSDEFREVMARRSNAAPRSALRYYGGWASKSEPAVKSTFERYPRPWRADGDYIRDATGRKLFEISHELDDDVWREQVVVDAVDLINKEAPE